MAFSTVEGFWSGKATSLVYKAEAIFTKACKLLRYLHKESSHKCLPDVHIIIATVEVCAASCKVESVHDSGQLLSYIVCRLEWSLLNEVVITPLDIFMVWRKRKSNPVVNGKPTEKETESCFLAWYSVDYSMVQLDSTPCHVQLTLLVSMVNIQQGEVISIDVSKFHFCFISSFLCFIWPQEHLRN